MPLTQAQLDLLEARRPKSPFEGHGKSVLIGSGTAAVYVFADGFRIACYGQIGMVPQDDAERRGWQRTYLKTLLDELSRCVAQLQAALTAPAFGMGVDGFRWPTEPDWLAAHVGPPHLTKYGQPDGGAALAHLRQLEERTRAELQALDQPTSSPGGLLP
jgi:hypothetical protein